MASNLAAIERMRAQMLAWYKQGEEEAADTLLLPDLQALEEKAKVPPRDRTSRNRLYVLLVEERLEQKRIQEEVEQAFRNPNVEIVLPLPKRDPGATVPETESTGAEKEPP